MLLFVRKKSSSELIKLILVTLLLISEQSEAFSAFTKKEEAKWEIGIVKKVGKASFRKAGNNVDDVEFTIEAFGRDYRLEFTKNRRIIPKGFKVQWSDFTNGSLVKQTEYRSIDPRLTECHYIHTDEEQQSVAAISDCSKGKLRGFVSTSSETIEISPLTDELQIQFLRDPGSVLGLTERFHDSVVVEDLYMVQRATVPKFSDLEEFFLDDEEDPLDDDEFIIEAQVIGNKNPDASRHVELGVFFDATAYNLFTPFFTDEEILENLLGYFNQLSAIYKHPSLVMKGVEGAGVKVDLSVVKLEIFSSAGNEFVTFEGDRILLLDSFCEYQTKLNPPGDSEHNHWDLGVLLTGLDLWHEYWGDKEYDTLGIARTGSLCHKKFSCVVSEFGTVSGKDISPLVPYPSAGFSAVYILAHEIGHTFGLRHDGLSNQCNPAGHIMSAGRSEAGGETRWSQCSIDKLKAFNKGCVWDEPVFATQAADIEKERFEISSALMDAGVPSGKDQCILFMKDETAEVYSNDCMSLHCSGDSLPKKPPGSNLPAELFPDYLDAGPAFSGTQCYMEGSSSAEIQGVCQDNVCIAQAALRTSAEILSEVEPCKEGCIEGSMGYRKSEERQELCTSVCPTQRQETNLEYATKKCTETMNQMFHHGGQIVHSNSNPRQACLIICTADEDGINNAAKSNWFTLLDKQATPASFKHDGAFFPFGTLCHIDQHSGDEYFCQQNLCLPLEKLDEEELIEEGRLRRI